MPHIDLIAVDPARVQEIWHAARPLIEKAYKDGDQDIPLTILHDLRAGKRLLWLAVDEEKTIIAAMLTQLFEMTSGKMLKMQECGGERMQEWKHLRKRVEDYARAEGCTRVLIEGRPGWERVMPDYQRVAVVLEKCLTEKRFA